MHCYECISGKAAPERPTEGHTLQFLYNFRIPVKCMQYVPRAAHCSYQAVLRVSLGCTYHTVLRVVLCYTVHILHSR